jgi:alpha-N-acetylglucosamine transferase
MPADSHPDISSLRTQVFIQQVALVIALGCLTAQLYRQASLEGKQINQSVRIIAGYKQHEPAIIDILNQLVAYGNKHPDFSNAVLKKYGVIPDAAK